MRSVLLLLLLVAATAYGEPYKRKAAVPEVKHVERKKPGATTPVTVTADSILAAELLADGYRQQQAKILEQLIADTPDDDPEKPELMFRLAEHYSRQALYWRLRDRPGQ